MRTLFIAIAAFAASVVFAAEPATTVPNDPPAANEPAEGKSAERKSAEPEPAEAEPAKEDTKMADSKKTGPSPDVFVPSESISEDLPVPLPVDI
jgi:hypothetical protein